MELNGKKFESFRSLNEEFMKECSKNLCDENCLFYEKDTSQTVCFENWLDKYFSVEMAADEKSAREKWERELQRSAGLKKFLEHHGFTKMQASAIVSVLNEYVVKPTAEIEKNIEFSKQKIDSIIEEMGEDLGKPFSKFMEMIKETLKGVMD